jgi:hypothetical protein
MADLFLLENGTDHILLENGTDRFLLESIIWATTQPPGYTAAPLGAPTPATGNDIASASWLRRVIDVTNNMLHGKLNATLRITLTPSATSTTIIDQRITAYSAILLMPATADASAVAGSTYVSSQQNGQATITHPSSANLDMNFTAVILG